MIAYKCPCCGSPLPEPSPLDGLRYAPVGPVAKRAIELLLTFYPQPVPRRDLAHMIYSERSDGGPNWADGSLAVLLFEANKKLAKLGWRIGSLGRGSRSGVTLRPLA